MGERIVERIARKSRENCDGRRENSRENWLPKTKTFKVSKTREIIKHTNHNEEETKEREMQPEHI